MKKLLIIGGVLVLSGCSLMSNKETMSEAEIIQKDTATESQPSNGLE